MVGRGGMRLARVCLSCIVLYILPLLFRLGVCCRGLLCYSRCFPSSLVLFFLLFSWLIITACGIIYRHSCHFHYSKAALAFCFTLSHAAGEVTMGPSRCRALALALTIVYQQIEWSEWWTRRQQSNSKRWAGAAGSDPCALANRQ